jgi:hypothetical protein
LRTDRPIPTTVHHCCGETVSVGVKSFALKTNASHTVRLRAHWGQLCECADLAA